MCDLNKYVFNWERDHEMKGDFDSSWIIKEDSIMTLKKRKREEEINELTFLTILLYQLFNISFHVFTIFWKKTIEIITCTKHLLVVTNYDH